jgi:hypothetical protein
VRLVSTATGDRYADCLAGTWLAERLAVDPLKIDAMRRAGELIAVRPAGSLDWRYPGWQFDAWKPRHGIPRIVAAAREAGIDETRLYDLMTAPLGLTGDSRRLADLLVEGRDDEVVAALRQS